MLKPLVALTLLSSHVIAANQDTTPNCDCRVQHLSDPPYDNFFYSDCNADTQTVVTSPLPDSDLSIIGPRFIVAWPAGNSGVCTFFQPQSGKNGTLAIQLVNSTIGRPLGPVCEKDDKSENPNVGVEGVISFNASAELSVAILGSVRNIRDFTEGPSLLSPIIQDALKITPFKDGGVQISRLWLDNITTTTFTLMPWKNNKNTIKVAGSSVKFGAGEYHFSAYFNHPQLKQLTPKEILNPQSQTLIKKKPDQISSLSFFSYTEKLLAGGWRFLTYFGRDSIITALLLQDILSTGKGSAMEAVIGAALERVNRSDGSVCHEETIGDYATFVNLQKNISSTAAGFTYPMVDTDYFLPIVMARYFQSSPKRITPLLSTKAGTVDVENKGLTWGDLSYTTARKIMNITAAFEKHQKVENLIGLKKGEIVGQWRDSTYGLGNGRIAFDVNCALVPAALYAISNLAAMPGVFPKNSITKSWAAGAARRAKVWEDKTLPFFQYSINTKTAVARLEQFTSKNKFYKGPTQSDSIAQYSTNGKVIDYALAIKSIQSPDLIPVTHTDTGFRHYLLNSTNDDQLTRFINASANAILRPFPAGLTTPVGMVVANPALSNDNVLIANFTNSAYHGTVVWSWQLALMAKGLERQLARCPHSKPRYEARSSDCETPKFCNDKGVFTALKAAYNRLWDVIEKNEAQLQSEVWSWKYTAESSGSGTGDNDDAFKLAPLGALPPPPGVSGATESNVRQLWSLTFLAVRRNEKYA